MESQAEEIVMEAFVRRGTAFLAESVRICG